MKIKRIDLRVIAFTFTSCLAFTFGASSFAECPSGYSYDCGDVWCCGNTLLCILPSEVKEELCTEEPELECPSISLYGKYSKAQNY